MNSTEDTMHFRYYYDLELELGYEFRDINLLTQALIHSSYANHLNKIKSDKHPVIQDNERLEWLGDSLLGAAVSLRLYMLNPSFDEADLTRARSSIVSRAALAEVGRKLHLEKYVIVLNKDISSNLNILSNAVESIIGAMYLDWHNAETAGNPRNLPCNAQSAHSAAHSANPIDTFINRFISLKAAPIGGYGTDWKSLLQEYLQGAKLGAPIYITLQEQGPEHAKMFSVCVRWSESREDNSFSYTGLGNSLKRAQQAAACKAYIHLTQGSKP